MICPSIRSSHAIVTGHNRVGKQILKDKSQIKIYRCDGRDQF